MAIPGIVAPIDAQLQGQVPLPAGVQGQPLVPGAVAPGAQQLAQVQGAPAPQPQQVQAQAPSQAPPEPPGPFGIPPSKLPGFLQATANPAARMQMVNALAQSFPAPTDEEFDQVIAQLVQGGV